MRAALAIVFVVCCGQAANPNPCMTCHPAEVKGYASTGMANALSRAASQPAGEFLHAVSETKFSVVQASDGMHQRITRGGVSGDYRIAYVVGSGHRAFGYLVQMGDYLFQSPITYQTQERAWTMAPGYEDNTAPDFNRPVGFECLLCHSGKVQPVKGTRNRYRNPPVTEEGISCERCHGPAAQHVVKPSRANIVNPGRLEPDARDSICEQCHLQGEARILNPGRTGTISHPAPRSKPHSRSSPAIRATTAHCESSANRNSCAAAHVGKRAAAGSGAAPVTTRTANLVTSRLTIARNV